MSGTNEGAPPEKRQSARRRTLLRGKLVHSAGSSTQDCAIRNLSETGAQVRVTNAQSIPDKVQLIDITNAMLYEAEIVWRRAPEFGLRFLAGCPAQEAPPRLYYLRQLWLECSRR